MTHSVTYLPGVQLMELMACEEHNSTLAEQVARIADTGFYRSIETSVLCQAPEAAEIAKLCQANGIYWTSWASLYINGEHLNLSSLEPEAWKHAVARVSELMDIAAQSGANAFSILSGPRPQHPHQLPEALARAQEAMTILAAKAGRYENFTLLIEPLDRDVHKHGAVGTAKEAAKLIRTAREQAENELVYMVWDSSHMALQEKDLHRSLQEAGDTVGHVHLCNAVLDPASGLYGDYHLMPGAPGYLTDASAVEILNDVKTLSLTRPVIPVAVEARPKHDGWAAEAETRAFLTRAAQASGLF